MRIRQLINRAAICALMACVFLMLGIANSSYGGLINSPNYDYEWNEFFTPLQGSSGLTYGDPSVVGNGLNFQQNLRFSSLSTDTHNSDFVDGKLTLDISAKNGQAICGITLNEGGVYGFGFNGTDTSAASVTFAGAKLFITEINGEAVSTLIENNWLLPSFKVAYDGTMIFNPDTPTTQVFKKTGGFNPVSGEWSGSMTIDLSNALNGTPLAGKPITGASLVFDNQLETVLGTSTRSFIDKKYVQISVIPTAVPEPSTIILLGMGAVALVFARKRK